MIQKISNHFKYFAGFFLVFTISTFSQTNWIWQNPLPVGKNLNAGQAFDAQNCYIVGNAGAFVKTADAGANWQVIPTGTNNDLISASFIDMNTGVMGCSSGKILRTSDGGNSFQLITVDSVRDVKSIQLLPGGKAFAAGDKGLFLSSQDNGITWSKGFFDTVSIASLFFFDNNRGFLAGESGSIYSTSNGGNSWNLVNSNISLTISKILFTDNLNGWAFGREGLALKTVDGGITWTKFNAGFYGWLKTASILPGNQIITAGAPGVVFKTDNGGTTWNKISDSSKFSFNYSTFSGDNGWVFGNNGLIMHTTDAGANWEFQSEGSENTINSIDFLDPMIGTAVGDSGLILRTEDGGDTWVRQFTDQMTNLNDLYFLDTIRGWIVGDDGTILQTLDAGQNWVRQDISHLTTDDLYSIEGTKRSNKVAGQNGAYLISNNEPTGATWGKGGTLFHTYRGIYSFSSRSATLIGDGGTILLMLSPPSGIIDQSIDSRFDLRDIYFPPGGIGWIVGKYGIVLKSTFLGGSWKIIDTLPVNWLNSVYFYDTLNGFTAGSFGSFYRTSNSGYDWVKVPTGVTNTFKKSYFFDQNNGWLVGTYGLLMKTTNGGGTGTPTSIEEKPAIPVSLELQQNYPNPFNPVTTINFVVPDAGNYRLTVYDILGNETGTLHEGFLGAGSHFVSFDGNNYASGVYFYRLSGNGQNLVRKMVLLK